MSTQPPAGYGQPPPFGYGPQHPKATTALVLGICSLVVCGLLGPFAWVIGKNTMNEIDASDGRLAGRGVAQAGYVCGIIATCLLGLGVLFFVFALAFVFLMPVLGS